MNKVGTPFYFWIASSNTAITVPVFSNLVYDIYVYENVIYFRQFYIYFFPIILILST